MKTIIAYLSKIGMLNIAIRSNKLTDIIRKEFKVFLGNPNFYYAYTENPEIGTIRESFILKVFKNINLKNHFNEDIILPNYGDLIFSYKNKKYLFEIGGKNKKTKQISGIENSFIVSDNILIGEGNKIPIWLFGLIK